MKKITETLKAAVILKFIFILFIVSILSKEGFAYQDTITLGALSDNTLYEDAAGTISNGQGKYLHTGKGNTGLIRRALVRFMLVEFVPPCSKILSVTLKMHLSGGSTANKTIQLRRITDYWGEGNSDAPGLEENGTVSTSYDATWKHKFYNSDFWANAGGDYSAVSSGNAVVGAPGFYTWGSTPQMVSDVQNWTDDNSTANGWLLLGDESATSTAKRFHSSEADTFSFVPEITVIYKTANFSLYMESLIEGFWDGATMVDDTLKVKLRNSNFPYNVVDSAAEVCGTYGGNFCFFNAPSGDYYISVNHRNTIETWSKQPVTFIVNDYHYYDFTDFASKAYGDNEVYKLLENCFYSGDVNQDMIIDATDMSMTENDASNSLSGYVSTDVTGDDFVDAGDLSIVENNVGVSAVTP